MRSFALASVLIVTSCNSKPSRLLGPVPKDAGELLGTLCLHANGGALAADADFKTAKIAFSEKAFAPTLEAVRCLPKDGPDPALNSLVFDHETRRLFGIAAMLTYADFDVLDKLVLPALNQEQRAGYALEKMRLNAPWMPISATHSWTDGHVVIWTQRTESLDNRWPPKPDTKFQIAVSTKK
jgi:hypothetical protein